MATVGLAICAAPLCGGEIDTSAPLLLPSEPFFAEAGTLVYPELLLGSLVKSVSHSAL
ncbi:hypothetical protein F441_15788 [Phytophthora nicotianae CJ01A1]|uniref:Uncharacterized protein n=3 Tax=Phytophthora nicotianae TaxID=4792 RepID=V9FMH9_PHYNI|nr:hypothetical protein F443_05082 [Phytophthora nicotianae P1569]ETL77524.1 hypothetical protein L917_21533 [Phytophthora nicotianae]ETP08168.1 hypothetical protein F441_15788 [Phytophthora nicotianae CJ01A1]